MKRAVFVPVLGYRVLRNWPNILCAPMLLFFCGTASAGSITINDLTDTVFFTDNTGGRLGGIMCSNGETCGFSITGPAGTTNITANAVAANLLEPGTFNASDSLQEQINSTITFWLFTSDGESGIPFAGGCCGTGFINNLEEDGTPQNAIVISYFNAAGAPNGTDTIFIQSDLESGVPEPSTCWMALGGLGLLSVLRRRIRWGQWRGLIAKPLLFTLVGSSLSTLLSAGPITVMVTFTGSGSVGGTPFTNANTLLTAIGDTSSNTVVPGGVIQMNPTSTTIAITGFSLATVADVVDFGDNQPSHSMFFSDVSDELTLSNAAFTSYNLQTSLGPLNPLFNNPNWATIPIHSNLG